MAQVEKYISGKAYWSRLTAGQEDAKFKRWGLDLYLDEAQAKVFKDWGSELTLRDETTKFYIKESGLPYWIKLGRSTVKLIKEKLVKFDPPELLNADNKPWTGGLIGNGSEVTCKVTVFDSVKGKGVRLEAVRVDVHVPYAEKEVDVSNVDSPF